MPRVRDVRPEIDEDEDEDDLEIAVRDYFMARLAAGRSAAQDALAAIDEAIALCTVPEEDASGKKRAEAVDTALEALGVASRAVEKAEDVRDEVDPEEGEPEDDDEAEDPEPEIPRATARERRRR